MQFYILQYFNIDIVCNIYTMSSDCYHLLNVNIWKEIADRKIQPNGYVCAERTLVDKCEVKLLY